MHRRGWITCMMTVTSFIYPSRVTIRSTPHHRRGCPLGRTQPTNSARGVPVPKRPITAAAQLPCAKPEIFSLVCPMDRT